MVGQAQRKDYSAVLVEEGAHKSADNLRAHVETLFAGLPLQGKRVLDIGGGSGLFSFYAASAGAAEVVCLEPLLEGSTRTAIDRFHRVQARLALPNVRLEPVTFQAFDPGATRFDVVLLHNSVNHLDEPACEQLHQSEAARNTYRDIFAKLYALTASGGTVIIRDVSRENFYARIGVKNVFAPTIEWHKHQPPELWIRLLTEVGYRKPQISWPSFNRLGAIGRLFLGNRAMAYMLTSHFCIRMSKLDGDR